MCKNLDTDEILAMKIEDKTGNIHLLGLEAQILKSLKGDDWFPKFYWFGNDHEFNCLVYELLGPNLKDMMVLCGGKFSITTVVHLAK